MIRRLSPVLVPVLVAAAVVAGCGAPEQATVARPAPVVGADVLGAPGDRPRAPVASADDLRLVFEDGFDGGHLDQVWSTCYWWQVDGGCTIASNGEQQWYRPEAVTVADGAARLELSADPQRTTDGATLPLRSGMISTGHLDADDDTRPGFVFAYGVAEARVRLPEGDGVWPAMWLLSADRTSLPEIDVFEWYGARPSIVTSHVHRRADGARSSSRVETSFATPLGGGWHDVAVDWTPERIVFYFDGVETGRVEGADLVPDEPMYLIVNLAAGGEAGPMDTAALPQVLLVDDVRIWQRGER